MFCPNCGTQLPDDSKFCFKCGFQLVKPYQSEEETEVETSESIQEDVNEIIENTDREPDNPSEINARNNNQGIIWEIISALIFLAGFCLVRLLR